MLRQALGSPGRTNGVLTILAARSEMFPVLHALFRITAHESRDFIAVQHDWEGCGNADAHCRWPRNHQLGCRRYPGGSAQVESEFRAGRLTTRAAAPTSECCSVVREPSQKIVLPFGRGRRTFSVDHVDSLSVRSYEIHVRKEKET